MFAPSDSFGAGLSEQHLAERNTRHAGTLMDMILALDDATPLNKPRPANQRIVGTCRHHAVLAVPPSMIQMTFGRADSYSSRNRQAFRMAGRTFAVKVA